MLLLDVTGEVAQAVALDEATHEAFLASPDPFRLQANQPALRAIALAQGGRLHEARAALAEVDDGALHQDARSLALWRTARAWTQVDDPPRAAAAFAEAGRLAVQQGHAAWGVHAWYGAVRTGRADLALPALEAVHATMDGAGTVTALVEGARAHVAGTARALTAAGRAVRGDRGAAAGGRGPRRGGPPGGGRRRRRGRRPGAGGGQSPRRRAGGAHAGAGRGRSGSVQPLLVASRRHERGGRRAATADHRHAGRDGRAGRGAARGGMRRRRGDPRRDDRSGRGRRGHADVRDIRGAQRRRRTRGHRGVRHRDRPRRGDHHHVHRDPVPEDTPSVITGDLVALALDGVPPETPPELIEPLLGVMDQDDDRLALLEPVLALGPILSVMRMDERGDLVQVTDAAFEPISTGYDVADDPAQRFLDHRRRSRDRLQPGHGPRRRARRPRDRGDLPRMTGAHTGRSYRDARRRRSLTGATGDGAPAKEDAPCALGCRRSP